MRNALGGKAGGHSYGKTYDFHDVTILFTVLTFTLHGCINFLESMCTSRKFLCSTFANLSRGGRFGNISAGFVRAASGRDFVEACGQGGDGRPTQTGGHTGPKNLG